MTAFHDFNYEKQPSEEMMVKVHFAELTQSTAQHQAAIPLILNYHGIS